LHQPASIDTHSIVHIDTLDGIDYLPPFILVRDVSRQLLVVQLGEALSCIVAVVALGSAPAAYQYVL
jgi:hypothetical protein